MLGKPKMPPIEPGFEAMAAELNPRGEPYRLNGLTFTPGDWVEVPASLLPRLDAFGWATVREKGAA